MPYKPKRPCAYPGCGRLADSGQYCAEHQKVMDKRYNRYERGNASVTAMSGSILSVNSALSVGY